MHQELQQIYWYSGLYLQPQHFQSLDLHNHYMLAQQRRLMHPWNYGVIKYALNTEALQDFIIKFDQLQLLLPSGYYLEFPGNCLLPLRSIRGIPREKNAPLTFWLALRRFDPRTKNVSYGSTDGVPTRWITLDEERAMKDVYHEGPDAVIQRIAFHLALLSEEEKSTAVDCECIPVLRLHYDKELVSIDQDFIPPAVTLNGVPVLKKMLDGIYADLCYRARQLETNKFHDGHAMWSSHPEQLIQLQVMLALNRALPLLYHYCSTSSLHPWYVYGLLSQLASELSSLSEEPLYVAEWKDGTEKTHAYDHNQLFDSFESLKTTLIAQLNQLLHDDTRTVILHEKQDNIYGAETLPDLSSLSGPVYLLIQSEQLTHIDVTTLQAGELKVASESSLSSLIQFALPGVTAQLLIPPPRNAPIHNKHTFYFQLDTQDRLWEEIIRQQNIAFYWAKTPRDLQVHILLMAGNK